MANRVLEFVSEGAERLKLFGYFGLILVLGTQLPSIFSLAWENAPIPRAVARLPTVVGVSFEDFTVLMFGIYLGLLTMMTIDIKKRWQGVLLWIGTLLSLVGLQSRGLFLPNIDLLASAVWLVGGFVSVCGVIGASEFSEAVDRGSMAGVEFRGAATWLFRIVVVITLVAFVEYHIRYPTIVRTTGGELNFPTVDSLYLRYYWQNLPRNLVVVGLFVGTMRQFVQYDAEKEFFVLGPSGSGKSLFLVGAYITALRKSQDRDTNTPLDPSSDLIDMSDQVQNAESGWGIDTTTDVRNELSFEFVYGSVFPVNIRLESVDYPGERLENGDIVDALTQAEESPDPTIKRVVEGIESADVLVLLLDVGRFVEEDSLDIEQYFSILDAIDDKDTLLVATKADYFLDTFEDQEGLDPFQYPEEFRRYVNDQLRGNIDVDSLVQQAGGADILPVYYQTRVTESGDRVPLRGDRNDLVTAGFERLLDYIGRH